MKNIKRIIINHNCKKYRNIFASLFSTKSAINDFLIYIFVFTIIKVKILGYYAYSKYNPWLIYCLWYGIFLNLNLNLQQLIAISDIVLKYF